MKIHNPYIIPLWDPMSCRGASFKGAELPASGTAKARRAGTVSRLESSNFGAPSFEGAWGSLELKGVQAPSTEFGAPSKGVRVPLKKRFRLLLMCSYEDFQPTHKGSLPRLMVTIRGHWGYQALLECQGSFGGGIQGGSIQGALGTRPHGCDRERLCTGTGGEWPKKREMSKSRKVTRKTKSREVPKGRKVLKSRKVIRKTKSRKVKKSRKVEK